MSRTALTTWRHSRSAPRRLGLLASSCGRSAAIWQPCSRRARQIDSTAWPWLLIVSMKPMISGCGFLM